MRMHRCMTPIKTVSFCFGLSLKPTAEKGLKRIEVDNKNKIQSSDSVLRFSAWETDREGPAITMDYWQLRRKVVVVETAAICGWKSRLLWLVSTQPLTPR